MFLALVLCLINLSQGFMVLFIRREDNRNIEDSSEYSNLQRKSLSLEVFGCLTSGVWSGFSSIEACIFSDELTHRDKYFIVTRASSFTEMESASLVSSLCICRFFASSSWPSPFAAEAHLFIELCVRLNNKQEHIQCMENIKSCQSPILELLDLLNLSCSVFYRVLKMFYLILEVLLFVFCFCHTSMDSCGILF